MASNAVLVPALARRPPTCRAVHPHPAAHRVVRLVGITSVIALLAAACVAPALVGRLAVPLAVVGVLIGLPHGAVDHVVPGWLAGSPVSRARAAAVVAGYAGAVGAAVVALRLVPTATVVVFLALSAWHFGRGEVVAQAEAAGRPVPGANQDLCGVAGHGLVTVLLPVAAHPAVSLPVLAALAPGLADVPMSTAVVRLILAGVAVVVLGVVTRLALARRWADAAELLLLAVVFAVVHPFAAFGVYFGLWHALRHTLRLVELAAPAAPLLVGVRRFARQAAVPTGFALAFLALVWATALVTTSTGAPLLAAELATLAALTFPHAGVVALMDSSLGRGGARPALPGPP